MDFEGLDELYNEQVTEIYGDVLISGCKFCTRCSNGYYGCHYFAGYSGCAVGYYGCLTQYSCDVTYYGGVSCVCGNGVSGCEYAESRR